MVKNSHSSSSVPFRVKNAFEITIVGVLLFGTSKCFLQNANEWVRQSGENFLELANLNHKKKEKKKRKTKIGSGIKYIRRFFSSLMFLTTVWFRAGLKFEVFHRKYFLRFNRIASAHPLRFYFGFSLPSSILHTIP